MVELRRGTATILDREESSAPTSPDPELEPVARELRIGSGTEDSSITVIENPSVADYTGILLARHFYQRFQWKDLIDVLHIRADSNKKIQEPNKYNRVRIDKGFDNDIFYNFVVTDTGLILPVHNVMPYEICFIPPSAHDYFRDELERGINVEDVLESMYKTLAQRVSIFSLTRINPNLILPTDYASLRI